MLRMVSGRITSSGETDDYHWPIATPATARRADFKIRLSFPTAELGELPAQAALRQLALADIHRSPNKVRHPFAIYNISISRILRRLRITLKAASDLNMLLSTKDLNTYSAFAAQEAFLDTFETLIYAFAEHHEDVRNIIGLLHGTEKKERQKAIRRFSKSTAPLTDRYLTIVNQIKHGHQRFQPVAGYIVKGSIKQLVFGYYIASFDRPAGAMANDDKGIIQPDIVIHPDGTANSIPRDLKNIVAGIVQFSELIVAASQTVVRTIDVRYPAIPCEFIADEIVSQLNALPDSLFPQELGLPIVDFSFHKESETVVLECQLFNLPPEDVSARLSELVVLFRSDGVNDIFKLPFWGEGRWSGKLEVKEFPGA